MAVARISIMHTASDFTRPASDKKAGMKRLLNDLEDHFPQNGWIGHGVPICRGRGREPARSGVPLDIPSEADHAATLDHTIALRSQIHRLTEAGHLETIVEITGNPKNIPSLHNP
jgi:hypothetical protein